MPFQPGNKLYGSRKGIPNKVASLTAQRLQEKLKELGIDVVSVFFATWQKIEDPIAKTQTFLEFMEFILPKQRLLQMDISLEDAIRTVEEAIESSGTAPIIIGPAEELSTETDIPS